MSYALALPGRAWPAPTLGALPISAGCRKAASSISDIGKYLSLSPAQTEKLIADCCSGFQEEGDAGERTARLAECVTRAASAAAAAAACTLAGAPFLAGVCASVGGFLADRVIGYDTGGKVAFTAGALVCGPSCGFVLAELTEFFSGTLAPLVSKIFDPGAARRREAERHAAIQAAYAASEKAMHDAEDQTIASWKASVNRIWDLYENLFQTAAARADATKALGISASYPSVAAALIAAGVPYEKMPDADIKRHQDDIKARGSAGAPGCEFYGKLRNGSYGPVSGLCPPFWRQRFLNKIYGMENAPAVATELAEQISDFFLRLQVAEVLLSTRISMYATMQKAAQAIADSRSRQTLASKATWGAAAAEGAAMAVLNGNSEESKRALERAKNSYNLTTASYKAILDTFGYSSTAITSYASSGAAASAAAACRDDKDCQRAAAAVVRAKKAYDSAQANAVTAAHKRVLLGTVAMVGVAGAAYLLLKSRG